VISTGGGAVVASAAPAALGPGGTGNSRIGSEASTAGAASQATSAAGAASARPSAGWTPTRPNTPTTTAKPIALTCRGQPRRSAPPLCGFPSFTLSPMPQIHRLPGRRWRAEGDVWATSAKPGPALSPPRNLLRDLPARLRLHEDGLKETLAPAGQPPAAVGWIVSVFASPRRTRMASCPLVSV